MRGVNTLKRREGQLIIIALAKTNGNRRDAAILLDMPLSTLEKKIAQRTGYKIPKRTGHRKGKKKADKNE